jgi:hypothetical protein
LRLRWSAVRPSSTPPATPSAPAAADSPMLVIVPWLSCEPLLEAFCAALFVVLLAVLPAAEAPFEGFEVVRFFALELCERLLEAVRLDPFAGPRPRLLEPDELARCFAAGISHLQVDRQLLPLRVERSP